MPDHIVAPIIIGITGKRELNGKDEAVRSAISACFDLLDRRLAASSKLFLTGLASGVDTIAADLALTRGWKVIAVLPFSLELYLEDFDAAGAQRLRVLADPNVGLLADPAKGRVIVLDPLTDPETKRPFAPSQLAHRAEGSNPNRSDHYEQVGLYIADRSALLIAVMPAAEKPDRTGGTARIVSYRILGADEKSATILHNSPISRKSLELDAPPTALLWLIDLESVDAKSDNALHSVQMWEPDVGQKTGVRVTKWKNEDELIHGLRLACRINAFNELAQSVETDQSQISFESQAQKDKQWKKEFDERKRPDLGDATSTLRKIRAVLSTIQGHKKRKLTNTINALTVLFGLAIVFIEFHILAEDIFTITIYCFLLIAIVIVFGRAKSKILQQYSEDYRAVSEALRVQIAWWDAGLTKPEHRVDRTYLSGTAGSLAFVRGAVRHLIDAACLEKAAPPKVPERVAEWVSDQVEYFKKRTDERRKLLTRFEHAIWFLFSASIGMAFSLIVLALMLLEIDVIKSMVKPIDDTLMEPGGLRWLAAIAVTITVAAMFAAALKFGQLSRTRHFKEHRSLFEHLNRGMGLTAGVLITVAIYVIVAGVNPAEGTFGEFFTHHIRACSDKTNDAVVAVHCSHNLAHNLAITVMIILASVAGAIRFYSERHALEAELHAYRESLESFRRADDKLFTKQSAINMAQRENILLELGMHALKENESWIRAHRVRPLEPHV